MAKPCQYHWNFYSAFKSRTEKVVGIAVDLYWWKRVFDNLYDCPIFSNMPLLEVSDRDTKSCIPIAGFTSCDLFEYQ